MNLLTKFESKSNRVKGMLRRFVYLYVGANRVSKGSPFIPLGPC